MRPLATLLVVMAMACAALVAMAQDRGRFERRDGRNGGEGRPGFGPPGPPGGFDRFEFLIRRFDANGDGTISPNEMEGRRREFFERMARDAGLNPSQPIPVNTFREALQRRMAQTASQGGGRFPQPGVSWRAGRTGFSRWLSRRVSGRRIPRRADDVSGWAWVSRARFSGWAGLFSG